LIPIWNQRRELCDTCPTPCKPLPNVTNPDLVCPLPVPRFGKIDSETPGLGDWVERMAKPVAKLLKLPCLDENGNLKADSGCAKRRKGLNNVGRTVYRLTHHLKPGEQ
jgi:hypothetical protein